MEEKSVPHLCSNVSDHVTISLGINTIIPSDESSIDEFINNTDKALYMAKKRRNCSYLPEDIGYTDSTMDRINGLEIKFPVIT